MRRTKTRRTSCSRNPRIHFSHLLGDQAVGDLPRATALLAPLHPNADDAQSLEAQAYQAILERQPGPMIARLKELLDKSNPAFRYLNGDLRFWLGWARQIAGDHAAAQKGWQQGRSELESALEEQPENFNVLSDLAMTTVGLGDKVAAFAFAERAIAANPIEKDAVSGPSSIETLARVAARMGEPDRAIAALQTVAVDTRTYGYRRANYFRSPPTRSYVLSDPE